MNCAFLVAAFFILTAAVTPGDVSAGKLKKIGNDTYYVQDNGSYALKKWVKIKGEWHYFRKKGKMAVKSFVKTDGKTYYVNKNGVMVTGWKKINGKDYFFDSYGVLDDQAIKTPKGKTTLLKFLKIAIKPVGSTMYVWGGGWNEEDTAAGDDAVSMGLNPRWAEFAKAQDSSYDYNNTLYQLGDGLDCSGFVGWVIYNNLNYKGQKEGYVMKARLMASNFASRGWGVYNEPSKIKDYKPGDIMSSGSHVWICLGQCKDGSVVLVHSNPSGVQINGTVTPNGETNSIAARLAAAYMQKYYPDWQKRYPVQVKNISYLTDYGQMRWTMGKVMSDPDGISEKYAAGILRKLFN